jgi:electron transfer flavoprotein alpha subunit
VKTESGGAKRGFKDVWIFVEHGEGTIEGVTFGLIGEARRIISRCDGQGAVTAVALGSGLNSALETLSACGADRVLSVENGLLSRYHGELFAQVMFEMVKKFAPSCLLMAQGPNTQDLSARLAALLETALVTHAMDFEMDKNGNAVATRPIANGYLFERLAIDCEGPPIICFVPAVLMDFEPGTAGETTFVSERMNEQEVDLKTKVVEVIEADPERLDLEEADIVVAGGRGVGKGESFNIMHELAGILGGSVGGTRPIIDWEVLPFERQIGQTGKTVVPRLIFTCGVSGANEFTAGMERSQLVIAINADPRARIFRFADLGAIGDVHEVLPLLIARLKALRDSERED